MANVKQQYKKIFKKGIDIVGFTCYNFDSDIIKMIVWLSNGKEMTIKDAKTNFIIDRALELILERSIAEVTVHDIASCAEVGEATIYRYFLTKQNLVCAAAIRLQNRIFETYFGFLEGKNGYEKLAFFYRTYLKIFTTHREFFKFINEFDAYILSEGKTSDEYDTGLDLFKAVCTEAYTQGEKDGSITPVKNWDIFYYATTHALLELCKKLSAKELVKQDLSANKEEEILTLTEIILHSIKA